MPAFASKKQYRMMMAILHGSAKDGPRGRPPKSIAAKYTAPGKDAPESKHKDTGETWGEEHHKKARAKVKVKLKRLSSRGIICFGCNVGLRKFYDRAQRLINAGLYIQEYEKFLVGASNDANGFTE